jgi:hypothetical protein
MRMEWQPVWFLLAGFVLGFATSTLWEWVYFRGVRQRNVIQTSAVQGIAPPRSAAPATTVVGSEMPADTGYRSPAVFIEGEQPTYESLSTPWNAAVASAAALETASTAQPDPPRSSTEPLESTTS